MNACDSSRPVLVTGASGFLGRHIVKCLSDKGIAVVARTHSDLDIKDAGSVYAAFAAAGPSCVIHCAAISSIAYAAEHPEEAYDVNVKGTCNVARACAETGIRLVYMSSDQVYGGCKEFGPLPESAAAPNNVYGKQKLEMEGAVREILPSATALRLTWMYQRLDDFPFHQDIVSRLAGLGSNGGEIMASTREFRGMTGVDTVCSNIVRAIGLLPGGVFNFGSGNTLSTYRTLLEVAGRFDVGAGQILPDDSWGRNLSMDCSKLARYGITFPDTVAGLASV